VPGPAEVRPTPSPADMVTSTLVVDVKESLAMMFLPLRLHVRLMLETDAAGDDGGGGGAAGGRVGTTGGAVAVAGGWVGTTGGGVGTTGGGAFGLGSAV